jgi:hypothetical protein
MEDLELTIRVPKPDDWINQVKQRGGQIDHWNGRPSSHYKTRDIVSEMTRGQIDIEEISDVLINRKSPERIKIIIEIEEENFVCQAHNSTNLTPIQKTQCFPWANVIEVWSYVQRTVRGKTKYYWHKPDHRAHNNVDNFFIYSFLLAKKDKFKKKEEIKDLRFADNMLITFDVNIYADGPLNKPGSNIKIRGSGYVLEEYNTVYYQLLELDLENRCIINKTKSINKVMDISNIDDVISRVNKTIANLGG